MSSLVYYEKVGLLLMYFYAPQLVPPGTAEARISYGNSVCLSVCSGFRVAGVFPFDREIFQEDEYAPPYISAK